MRSLKSIFCNALPSFLFRPPFYTGRKAAARRALAEEAAQFRALGEKDLLRLTRIFYAAAGRVPAAELPRYCSNSVACRTGRGPYFSTGTGYDAFKNGYKVSEDSVRSLVVPFLVDNPECELQLAFLKYEDSNLHTPSHTVYHAFLIFKTKP